ncbi:MAG: homoserine kinase type II [Rickettsiales bacterium]|jgi:homoserine kinase type II
MAVHTKLTKQEIASFIKENYQIGELLSFKEIVDGIDNSNFIIETNVNKFILTIFESRINADELPFFMNLKLHLAGHGISCPEPINNNSGSIISLIKNKSASIVSFLNGTTLKPEKNGLYDSITIKNCAQIGKVAASLHKAVLDFKEVRRNDLGISDWEGFFNKIAEKTDDYQQGLRAEIRGYVDFLIRNWQINHPKGVVHVDMFPDNVFFDKKGDLSGVIDFYFAANDLFIYDLAIVINAWCFDKNNQFSQEKYDVLLQEYQKIRPISNIEMEFLRIALVGASLRFLLTRLYDLFFTPEDSLVNIKDPQEYLQKTRFFFKNLS